MAWLNNLAEKAEYLLDRLDHKASVVLLQNENRNNKARMEANVEHVNDYSIDVTENLMQNENICASSELTRNSTLPYEERIVIPTNQTEYKNEQAYYINNSTSDLCMAGYSFEEYNKQRDIIQVLEKRNAEILSEYSRCKEEMTVLKNTLREYKSKNVLLNSQIKETASSLALKQKEIEKHRNQAQIILEDKETLATPFENVTILKNKSNDHNEYILKLIKARDDQQKRITELNEKLEIIQNDLIITQKYCSTYKEEAYTVQQKLLKEEKYRIGLEDEITNNKQELNKLYEDLKMHVNLLNSKNEALVSLQKKIDCQYTVTENEEMESKFHVLTKTLIMKQNSLETLTTERNALRLQLERLKADYARLLTEYSMKQKSLQSVNFDENGKSGNIFDAVPFNESLSQRVRRTITTLNSFSIRLGVFLRRYPVARIFLLCYMILLQIWVVVILFAYVPNSY